MYDERVHCAVAVFSGDLEEADSDAAAEALRAAGFQVFRLPPELKSKLDVEGDDYIEVRRGDRSRDKMEAEVDSIVEPLGGRVECGVESILEFFEPPPPRPNDNVVKLAGRRSS